jgi:carboxymethylenebutenolidase
MKTILIVLSFACIVTTTLNAQKHTCCSITATQEFSSLTADASFNASHAEPLPYVFNDDVGQMVGFKTPDGRKSQAFQILTPYKTNKWLFVFHEWWGLNDHIKKEAVKYFESLKDVNVLVIDLYDGNLATTREDAAKFMGAVEDARARSIIQGAISYVGKQATIGTVGWCFGGGWSLQATLMAGKQAAGAVMYYGMPEKDVEKLKTLQAEVLFMLAQKDEWITPELVVQFEADMKTAGKVLTVKSYDAVHAFANPSNSNFDVTAANDAYSQSIKFLAKQFFQKGG